MPTQHSEASRCPVCANATVELYRDDGAEHDLTSSDLGSSRHRIQHGKILRCKACGLAFQAWRPSDQDLASLYRELDPAVYEKEASGRLHTARRHLKIVCQYIRRGRLLDVGCASGAFLGCAADQGFEVVGVEPSRMLSAKAKELLRDRGAVLCCALQDTKLEQSRVNVLTLWDVLEHVTNPLVFLNQCASLVTPGGYIFANVPDVETWQARLLGERWPLLLAEHFSYFSRTSLMLAGKVALLQVVKFGRRPSSFSLEYVLYRLAQHRCPGAVWGLSMVRKLGLGSFSVPAYLGETYVVWRRV